MTRAQLVDVCNDLKQASEHGYTRLTWNGVGFDLDGLAEESNALVECRQLAYEHIDMMLHVFCELGYPVSLESAAQGQRIAGKLAGMSGHLAPQRWAQGQYQEVIDYVVQDVRIALELARKSDSQSEFRWITKKGSPSTMPLPRGWLTVRDALKLPQPDSSWMREPIPRSRFIEWLG